jgi:hypothetical protein
MQAFWHTIRVFERSNFIPVNGLALGTLADLTALRCQRAQNLKIKYVFQF